MQKTARKNNKYFRNERSLKIGHLAKAIAFPKRSVWIKNRKCQSYAKSYSTRKVELFWAENRSKKHLIFEKPYIFENWPSCKGYSPCNGYSMWEMVTLSFYLSRTLSNTGSLRPRWFIHVWSLYRGLYFGWVLLAWYMTVSAPRVFIVWNSSNEIVPVKRFTI